jgi:hypothetical protein
VNILILIVAILTLIVVAKRFGLASFLGAGYFGFFIYSIPAFINRARYFYYLDSDFYLYEPSFETMAIYLIAWTTFLLCVIFITDTSKYRNFYFDRRMRFASREFLWSGVFLSTCFFAYLILYSGQQVVDGSDSLQLSTVVLLIGRWILALSLIAALVYRSFIPFIFLFFALLYWFVSGDRTLLGVTLMSVIVIFAQRTFQTTYISFGQMFNIKLILTIVGVVFVIIFGKPIYISINAGDLSVLFNTFEKDRLIEFFSQAFEPMIIFNHAQHVVDNSLEISSFDFLVSILSNFLIYPSAFEFSSNLYSQVIASSFPIEMSYGVAGSYWAHAYSVFGYFGVCFFAFIYVYFLYFCDRIFLSRASPVSVLIALLGGLVALYAHRNGLDNLLSFVRQILLAYFSIIFLSFFIRILTHNYKKIRILNHNNKKVILPDN